MKEHIALNAAIFEAKRFIDKAEKAKHRLDTDTCAWISGTKEMGAAKRASMDLTRALVDVRK